MPTITSYTTKCDLTWENGSEHSGSRGFADTEEVTGSNPVAPTTPWLTSANADHQGSLTGSLGHGTDGMSRTAVKSTLLVNQFVSERGR